MEKDKIEDNGIDFAIYILVEKQYDLKKERISMDNESVSLSIKIAQQDLAIRHIENALRILKGLPDAAEEV